jgi:DNA-binding transcriptional MerR regulator
MSIKSTDAFRTISEVAEELDLPQHVLRFWETRFPQIKPMKRGGGRRYYRPDDVALLKGIRFLLYVRGFTIKGVQRILKENGNRFVISIGAGDLSGLEAVQAQKPMPRDDDGPQPALHDDEIEPQGVTTHDVAERRRPLSNLFFGEKGRVASTLPPAQTAELNRVLLELLELKRLLDQTR